MISQMIQQIKLRLQQTHPRTRKVQLNIIWGIVTKGVSVIISLLLVPLTIDYLAKDVYGLWLTISSVVTMMSLLDIGIGNGLRNRFSEAVNQGNVVLARSYLSTAYAAFGILQFLVIIIFLIGSSFVSWENLLNANLAQGQLLAVVRITITMVAIRLVLDIVNYVLLALQKSYLSNILSLISNGFILAGTFFLARSTASSLVLLSWTSVTIPIVVLIISSIILYRTTLYQFRPSFKSINFSHTKRLLSLGYQFFLIQIAVVVLYYSDNIIISHLFGPAEVTTYNIAFRYFNLINTTFAIISAPYWSAFTEASVKNDIQWMKKAQQNLVKVWLITVCVALIMVLLASNFYKLWVGSRVDIPLLLNGCMCLFVIVNCWNSIVSSIINGLGKIRLQLFLAIISALINIPLAIFLGKQLHMGSAGVVLATSLSLLISSVFGGVQAKKLVTGKAKGLWNR